MWLLAVALAQESALWITSTGVQGFDWGTNDVPLDAVARPKDLVLPDSAFIGANKQDKPDDLEVKGPSGERHFLRYARGVLVDAWLLSERPLDPLDLVGSVPPEWSGVVLGPAEEGFLAYGVASSWRVGERTLLHWKDRAGHLEVIADRAAPTMQYGIGRPQPLELPGDTGAKATLKGDFAKAARPFAGPLASCFDTSPKPVEALITLKLDGKGEPSRIRVQADQPAFQLEDCVAAALMGVRGSANQVGTVEMRRFR